MKYFNAHVFTEAGVFEDVGFEVSGGKFAAVSADIHEGTDLKGAYVIPGLVDTHIHGALGHDFSDCDYDGLCAMAAHLASIGITSFAPASATVPYGTLEKAYQNAAKMHREQPDGLAYLAGIHMEGPFFSYAKRGAQNPDYLKEPDTEAYRKLQKTAEGLVAIVDVAPELPGALRFIREISRERTVSLAHTAAAYEEAAAAFDAGASHVTHLFNAMTGLGHREPGLVGAASERDKVSAELICDGHHIHPAAVRAAFKLFPGRICLISDCLCCLGMPDGQYALGGQDVILKNGLARLKDGTIAGAATDLYQDMLNAVSYGIPVADAIIAATKNPAREIGRYEEIGSISPNKRADFIICDEKLARREVYLGGKRLE